MNPRSMRIAIVCLIATVCMCAVATNASAQCSTCATPTVAYSPVVTQPVVAQPVYTGWYPGRFFDRLRTRRYFGAATAPATYTAAYAPTYTAAYAPAVTATPYTAAYAYSAAYRPYLTSYAPLTRTSYYVPTATSCDCARQVVLSPVAGACDPCGCNPCNCGVSTCSTCSSCSSGVGQAVYSEPTTGCSNCAAGTGTPSFSTGPNVGPATPRPELAPNEPAPGASQFDANRPVTEDVKIDPQPVTEEDSSTYFEAPRLFNPRDLTANRQPTVPVRQAVYKQPVQTQQVSHASQVDSDGWFAVPADR